MSYVIQNFYQTNKIIPMTPKLKYLLFFKNLKYIFIFLKIGANLLNASFNNNRIFGYFTLFYRYFYYAKLFKAFHNLNLKLVGTYTNNLKKSIVFHALNTTHSYLSKGFYCDHSSRPASGLLFNQYYASIKLVNFQINKKFYQNVFFYFLFTLPTPWLALTPLVKFHLNFFFVSSFFQLFKFYNGRFFKVYNY